MKVFLQLSPKSLSLEFDSVKVIPLSVCVRKRDCRLSKSSRTGSQSEQGANIFWVVVLLKALERRLLLSKLKIKLVGGHDQGLSFPWPFSNWHQTLLSKRLLASFWMALCPIEGCHLSLQFSSRPFLSFPSNCLVGVGQDLTSASCILFWPGSRQEGDEQKFFDFRRPPSSALEIVIFRIECDSFCWGWHFWEGQ